MSIKMTRGDRVGGGQPCDNNNNIKTHEKATAMEEIIKEEEYDIQKANE